MIGMNRMVKLQHLIVVVLMFKAMNKQKQGFKSQHTDIRKNYLPFE